MKKGRAKLRAIALERVRVLLDAAVCRARGGDLDLARRYVEVALRIAGKAKLKLPKSIKRGYCRKCFVPLIPGLTLSVRIRSVGRGSRVVYRCLLCGWTRRFMIKASRRESGRELPAK
ncbi:MAG: ribonuclease P Rpr2/Rpp21/SNM1 subunit [Desulfurococcaceae archaeon]